MTAVCPHCQLPLEGGAGVNLSEHFRGRAAEIVRLLQWRTGGISSEQLAYLVYAANDPSGGPDTVQKCLDVTICNMRPRVHRLGYDIEVTAAGLRQLRRLRPGEKPKFAGSRARRSLAEAPGASA